MSGLADCMSIVDVIYDYGGETAIKNILAVVMMDSNVKEIVTASEINGKKVAELL